MTKPYTTEYTITKCTPAEIEAIDLAIEIEESEMAAEAAHVQIGDCAETADVVYFPDAGRGGVAWGADATWTDAADIQDTVRRVLSGNIVA